MTTFAVCEPDAIGGTGRSDPLSIFAGHCLPDVTQLINAYAAVKQRLLQLLPDCLDPTETYCKACLVLEIRVDGLLLSQIVDPHISTLDLTVSYIAPNTLIALCCAMERISGLRKVLAARCRLSSPMVCLLCSSLAQTKSIEYLDIAHNPVGSEGAFSVYRLARVNYNLRTVELSGVEVIPSLFRKINNQLTLNASSSSSSSGRSK